MLASQSFRSHELWSLLLPQVRSVQARLVSLVCGSFEQLQRCLFWQLVPVFDYSHGESVLIGIPSVPACVCYLSSPHVPYHTSSVINLLFCCYSRSSSITTLKLCEHLCSKRNLTNKSLPVFIFLTVIFSECLDNQLFGYWVGGVYLFGGFPQIHSVRIEGEHRKFCWK